MLLGNSLLVLNLDDNGAKFVYGRAFYGLSRLKTLSLADNRMQFLPGNLFTHTLNVTTLVLRRTNLSSIFSRLFHQLAGLQRLDLSANSLQHLPVGWLRNATRLRHVDLSDNNLTTLSSCEFSTSISHINTISLVGNRFLECDCRLAWLVLHFIPSSETAQLYFRMHYYGNLYGTLKYFTLPLDGYGVLRSSYLYVSPFTYLKYTILLPETTSFSKFFAIRVSSKFVVGLRLLLQSQLHPMCSYTKNTGRNFKQNEPSRLALMQLVNY